MRRLVGASPGRNPASPDGEIMGAMGGPDGPRAP